MLVAAEEQKMLAGTCFLPTINKQRYIYIWGAASCRHVCFTSEGSGQSNVSELFSCFRRLALTAENYLFIHPLISVSVFSLV